MKRYWRQTNMKLNKKQQESIVDSLDISQQPTAKVEGLQARC